MADFRTLDLAKDYYSRGKRIKLPHHLKDQFNQKDMNDPNLNIAAGIRWLFRKQETASAKLKKPADWIWATADYKSYLGEFRKDPKHNQMNKLIKIYETLKKGRVEK